MSILFLEFLQKVAIFVGKKLGGSLLSQVGRDLPGSVFDSKKKARDPSIDEVYFLKSQRDDFQERLEQVSEIINELERKVRERTTDFSLAEAGKDELVDLVIEIKQVLCYQSRLEEIRNLQTQCFEAALWLRKNQEDLSKWVTEEIFSGSESIDNLINEETKTFSEYILKQNFTRDIDYYLSWIQNSLQHGLNPRELKPGKAFIQLSPTFYRQAFKAIMNEKIVPNNNNGLSIEAAEMLEMYIERWLLNRDFNADTSD